MALSPVPEGPAGRGARREPASPPNPIPSAAPTLLPGRCDISGGLRFQPFYRSRRDGTSAHEEGGAFAPPSRASLLVYPQLLLLDLAHVTAGTAVVGLALERHHFRARGARGAWQLHVADRAGPRRCFLAAF